jgi:hypothetical protein
MTFGDSNRFGFKIFDHGIVDVSGNALLGIVVTQGCFSERVGTANTGRFGSFSNTISGLKVLSPVDFQAFRIFIEVIACSRAMRYAIDL